MFRKTILCALASAAMISTAAIAQRGGGGGGHGGGMGPPSGMGGSSNAGGFGRGGPGDMGDFGNDRGMGDLGSSMRDEGRMNSEGPDHASPTGIAHADENSVLAGTTATRAVRSGALAGLTTGTTLLSNGMAVGTVQQIRTTGNGSVAVLIVKGTNGGLFAVPASKLTFSGGMLSTTARFAGINDFASSRMSMSSQGRLNSQGPMHASSTGIAHANSHSVLAGSATTMATNGNRRLNSQGLMHASPTGIAHANSRSVLAGNTVVSGSLAGLTTGLTVNTSTGTTLGRVSRIVTGQDGSVRLVLVTTTSGRMLRLSPTSLSLSGGIVTTTQTMASR